MSLRNLDSHSTLGFQHIGDFHLEEGKVRFTLNSHKESRGAYAFVVSENVRYIGVTEGTLYQRMNGYRNPGPTQETNKRIKPMIMQAQHVQIHFLPDSEISKFVTIIRRSDSEHQIPTDMKTFERFLISLFRPVHGQQTAQVARTLMQRLQPLGFDVLLAHGQRETDLEYLGEIVSWFSDEYKRYTRLAFLDIAVVSRITDKALVLAEVEERPASPKKILADVLATLIGDHISFTRHSQRRDLKVGSWTTLVILVSAHSPTTKTRLSSLRDRLDKVKDQLTTPNSSIGQMIIDSYGDRLELERKLTDQTEKVQRTFSNG